MNQALMLCTLIIESRTNSSSKELLTIIIIYSQKNTETLSQIDPNEAVRSKASLGCLTQLQHPQIFYFGDWRYIVISILFQFQIPIEIQNSSILDHSLSTLGFQHLLVDFAAASLRSSKTVTRWQWNQLY
jgi:hypothetical protein